jgi:hypothetical protein
MLTSNNLIIYITCDASLLHVSYHTHDTRKTIVASAGFDWLLFDRLDDDPAVFPFFRWKGVCKYHSVIAHALALNGVLLLRFPLYQELVFLILMFQLLHHGVSMYAIGLALLSGKAHMYILMVLFTEVTTPFVNLRW